MAQLFNINVLGSKKRGRFASTAFSLSPTRIRVEASSGLIGGAPGANTAINAVIYEYPNGSQGTPNEYWVTETQAAVTVLANAP